MSGDGNGLMMAALYADYIAELKTVFGELDRSPELFQTYDLHVDLAAAGGMIVYETRRRRGQTDSLYYGRPAGSSAPQKMAQAVAFAAIDRFFALGQFLAMSTEGASGEGEAGHPRLDVDYPHCAVKFSYRKKGHAHARSMLMIFVGFNDDADAERFASDPGNAASLVGTRPYMAARLHEWK